MRTPKVLYQSRPVVYTFELECCPQCGEPLVECGYQSAFKTVQTLSEVVRIAQRPKRCVNEGCGAHRAPLQSARWQRTAPLGCGYGYDVIGQIGWQRQERHQQYTAIHEELAERVKISESEVRYLHHYQYQPLLACSQRLAEPRLVEAAAQSGLLLTLDGLSPEGGEPQLWVVRELRTGLVLRSGWLSQQDTKTLVSFLQPIAEKKWPVLAVLSDKQAGIVAAVAQVFPQASHGFCQVHYLNNAAEPLEEASEVMKVALRKNIRGSVGQLIRAEKGAEATGVLAVTGVIPSPLPGAEEAEAGAAEAEAVAAAGEPGSGTAAEAEAIAAAGEAGPGGTAEVAAMAAGEAAADSTAGEVGAAAGAAVQPPATAERTAAGREREAIIQEVLRRVRYLLTLKSRPPFGLAGIEMFARLSEVAECLDTLIAHDPDPRLMQLREGLRKGLDAGRQDYEELNRAAGWLQQIAAVLDPENKPVRTGEQVRQELESYLEGIRGESESSERLGKLYVKMVKVTSSYSPGLFHSYDIPGLPRTNNGCESDFRDLTRHLLCATGQKGLTRRLEQREGAWDLLPHPPTLQETVTAISRIPADKLREEQTRVRSHRQRFRSHVRSPRRAAAQLNDLASRWLALTPREGS